MNIDKQIIKHVFDFLSQNSDRLYTEFRQNLKLMYAELFDYMWNKGKNADRYACGVLTKLLLESGINVFYEFNEAVLCMCAGVKIDNNKYKFNPNWSNISASAFYNTEFTNPDIVLPKHVQSLTAWCFRGSNITSVWIPKSVFYIGEDVFTDCPNLKEIVYEGSEKEWEAIIGVGNVIRSISVGTELVFKG